jgi:hypothetical protein
MSQIRKIDLTIPAQTSVAGLRTIESNLSPAGASLQVSFTNDGPVGLSFIAFSSEVDAGSREENASKQ